MPFRKLDFFIAGVQKAGTTALDAILRQHPSIQMARRKEVHFFDDEAVDWNAPDYTVLHREFDWSDPDRIRGEATPIYNYWPNALERIARYNPKAKLVICLRHPVFRAYSNWKMETKRGNDTLSFASAIREGRERFTGVHRIFSYVERGFYAPQVRRAKELFERVHVLRTDKLWRVPEVEMARLAGFLGVDVPEASSVGYIVPVDTIGMAAMPEEDHRYLLDLYAPDVAETMHLTDLDLHDWLWPTYSEPMRNTAYSGAMIASGSALVVA